MCTPHVKRLQLRTSCALRRRKPSSAREAFLSILRWNLACPLVAWDLPVDHRDWRSCRLCQAAALRLQSQSGGLGEARIGNLIIQQIHDLAEVRTRHILSVDGLHDPAALHTCNEGLALWITWVAGLWHDLLHHGTLVALVRRVAEHSERALLVDHLVIAGSGGGRSVRDIGITRSLAVQVLGAHVPDDLALCAASSSWRTNESNAARQQATRCTSDEERAEDGSALSLDHDDDVTSQMAVVQIKI